MPDQLFAELYRDTEHLPWDPAEEVRERARRRTRRTRVAAGLASAVAVAAVAVGAAAVAGRPDAGPPIPPATNVPTPSPTVAPSPSGKSAPTTPSNPPSTSGRPSSPATGTGIPSAALLTAADLPSGYRPSGSDLDGDWSLDAAMIFCRNGTPPLTARAHAERGAVFQAGGDRSVIERVRRYAAADAPSVLDHARLMATGCEPDQSAPGDLAVLDSGFAGDAALLIGWDTAGNQTRWVFVRQGDLVAEVFIKQATDDAEARRVAQRVAERLCSGTDAC